MMDTDEDRPLAGAPRVPSPSSYHLLECKLTDEAVGKERSLCVVLLSHDRDPLVSDEFREFSRLTSKLGAHFARVVHACQEHEAGSRLRLVPVPHGSHKLTVMLAQIPVKQVSRDVCGIHQVLDNREPHACPGSCLCPKTPSKIRQLRRIEIRTRSGEDRRSHHCKNRRRFNTYLLPGHHLHLESFSLPTQPQHATMSESDYSEIVEPGGPFRATIPQKVDRYTITLKAFLCNASCNIYCRHANTKASRIE